MREKAFQQESTFTTDVSDRQIPIHPCDWHLLGCQVEAGADVYINTVGTFGVASASYYCSRSGGCVRKTLTVPRRKQRTHLAYGSSGRQPLGIWRAGVQVCTHVLLRLVLGGGRTAILVESSRQRHRGMGRLRPTPSEQALRNLAARGRVVREVDQGNSNSGDSTHGQV